MALDPQFAATPKLGGVLISTANTARDGTGTLGTVVTAGANGSRLRGVHIRAQGTTTAGMVRLFLHDGTNFHFWKEVKIDAATPSASVEAFSAHLTESTNPELLPIVLPNNWSLRAATHNAESFRVIGDAPDL